jgi:hypothetical protein
MSHADPFATDPVVVWDLLREARARLIGTINVSEVDDGKFLESMRALDDRFDHVDVDDVTAQFELIQQLTAERETYARRATR